MVVDLLYFALNVGSEFRLKLRSLTISKKQKEPNHSLRCGESNPDLLGSP